MQAYQALLGYAGFGLMAVYADGISTLPQCDHHRARERFSREFDNVTSESIGFYVFDA